MPRFTKGQMDKMPGKSLQELEARHGLRATKRNLDTAKAHREADERLGRDWFTNGCHCPVCRLAKKLWKR